MTFFLDISPKTPIVFNMFTLKVSLHTDFSSFLYRTYAPHPTLPSSRGEDWVGRVSKESADYVI